MVRLQGCASEYREEELRRHLASVCRADRTATIGASAGFLNSRRNPNDIIVGQRSAVLGELATFPQGGRIEIGERCFVGSGTRIWSAASISVGNYVLIAHNVDIHDNISHSLSWSERRQEIDQILPDLTLYNHSFDIQRGSLVIEDDVWIGFGACIIGGVRIGRGAVVGAGTVVTKDVPEFSLIVGNPMRVVRKIPE